MGDVVTLVEKAQKEVGGSTTCCTGSFVFLDVCALVLRRFAFATLKYPVESVG